jgi:2-polyprenyl-3-methyl-5-hydroxy-6-metoxy-1,4-benzoquinol methylase
MYGRAYSHYCRYPKEIKKAKDPLQYLADAEPAYWAVIKIIREAAANRKDVKILEIGSGLGYFTYALNHAGYHATGIDISESGVAQARQTFGDYYLCADVTKWANEHREEYDIVFCIETIEHVNEALPFLQSIAACCKSGGGKIIVTTPNKSTYANEAVWCNSLPPFHMWWLSEASMHYMAKQIEANVSFMDWSEYHRQNRCTARTNPEETMRWSEAPFLDENGYAIHLKSPLYKYLANIPWAKRIGKKVMRIPEYRMQGSRGLILCAVFERQ